MEATGAFSSGPRGPAGQHEPLSVLLLHRQAIVREGVRSVIQSTSKFRVIGAYARPEEAIVRLQTDACPLLVVELCAVGLQFARVVGSAPPPQKVVFVCSGSPELDLLLPGLEMGVDTFIGLDDPDELLRGVQCTLEGRGYISPSWGPGLLRESLARRRESSLTMRECSILASLTPGGSLASIGKLLDLSTSTVKGHLSRIYRKLGIKNRSAAYLYAVEAGLTVGP